MTKSLFLILLAIVISVGGQLSLKYGTGVLGRIDGQAVAGGWGLLLRIVGNPYIVAGIGLYGLGAVVWIVVLSRVPLSFAYPMLGLSYVLILLVSRFILHEQVSVQRWIGAMLIVTGAALVSRTSGEDHVTSVGHESPKPASALHEGGR
ncbi:MAG: EamA family transporter [Candidatus Sericytochromatia bacterium]|nr:EamA family transporter [Candidatus Sericytochromatia bacterium]